MTGFGRRLTSSIAAVVAGGFAALIFARTAYPTITWWDSSSYSLAAATLGISSPPGSLLLMLIGWPVAHLASEQPAHALNLFAAVLAALTVSLVCVVAARLLGGPDEPRNDLSWPVSLGLAAGALTFAFSGTLWSYAGRFTPYVLTPVFTCLILWVMVRWWERADDADAWRSLVLLGLLFGLDFSVHRTNALLIPGAVLWVALRRPSTLRSPRAILGTTAGLLAGLSVQLLVMPLAAHTSSTLNFNNPSSWSRFWDYVTIKQLGGSFLLGVFPRKSPVWSGQTMDVLRVLADNFLRWRGAGGVVGILPTLAAMLGLSALWRRNRRLAAAFAGVLVFQAAFTVLYFNIPANYFRTFDRHYVPICVTIGVLVSCGLASVAETFVARARTNRLVTAGVVVAIAVVPLTQVVANWTAHDASRLYFARDFAANALIELPPNAIYFTYGDNDTFPVMYMQSAEGLRPDVTIINLSVANIPDWPEQLKNRDPSFPMSMSMAERMAVAARRWPDTTIALQVPADARRLGVPPETQIPASINLVVRPVFGSTLLPSEALLLDIVQTNGWRRPLTFAVTGTANGMAFLAPYGRIEGLYYRVVPLKDPRTDIAVLRAHLLYAKYRGYADPEVQIDDDTRRIGIAPYAGLIALLEAETAADHPNSCHLDRDALLAKLPLARLEPPTEIRERIENICKPPRT